MFKKSFCKNFLTTLPTGSLQSPTRIEEIKAKFCLVGTIEPSPANPKSQPNTKNCNNHQIPPSYIVYMKPIKQPKSFVKPQSSHHHDKWNPYLKPIKQPMLSIKALSLRLRHCRQTQTIPKIHQHKNHSLTKST